MSSPYYEIVQLVERSHRYFLDVLKVELERSGVRDINNVQAMILYNIGDEEMTVGDLTERGCYLGSNVSYNVKKMGENGYLDQERSKHDKRSVRVKLSDKGRRLHTAMQDMFTRHEGSLGGAKLSADELKTAISILQKLEGFWANPSNTGTLDFTPDEGDTGDPGEPGAGDAATVG